MKSFGLDFSFAISFSFCPTLAHPFVCKVYHKASENATVFSCKGTGAWFTGSLERGTGARFTGFGAAVLIKRGVERSRLNG